MIQIGKNITSVADPLQPVLVEKVYHAIINPNGEVAVLQNRLRSLLMIDLQQYRKLKTSLPYLVCAHFQPRVRKKENFVFTERFFVDIDHLSDFDFDIDSLKKTLSADSRIELLFTSPGGDGLKLLFRLSERIYDSSYYTLFYKSFCIRFAEQYGVTGALDIKTNDVSRCCFVSFDPEAYYNPESEAVNPTNYVPAEGGIEFEKIQSEIKNDGSAQEAIRKTAVIEKENTEPLSEDILNQIKMKVGVRVKKPVEKQYEQPEELELLIKEVDEQVRQVGAEIIASSAISYGRKIKIGAGSYWAEINLFYGKRGPSVVPTTKTGSNKQLCDSIVTLLKNHFNNPF